MRACGAIAADGGFCWKLYGHDGAHDSTIYGFTPDKRPARKEQQMLDVIPLPYEAVTSVIQGGVLGNRGVEIARFGSSALAYEYAEWISAENTEILFVVVTHTGAQTRYRNGRTVQR